MNKSLILILILLGIFISGCVTVKPPVSPDELTISSEKIVIKEYEEQDVSVLVFNNNNSQPIDHVSVSSFDPFTIVGPRPNLNIAANNKASINFRVQAPAINSVENVSMLTISYASGLDKNKSSTIQTKTIPIQTVVLPNASLQFVGFAEGMDKLLDNPPFSSWEAKKGDNITVKFSVKNNGPSTIQGESMFVLVDIENKQIGGDGNFTITPSMARGGTSYTSGIEIKLLDDAPNGETDVYVKLMQGDYVIDSQTLLLKVKL